MISVFTALTLPLFAVCLLHVMYTMYGQSLVSNSTSAAMAHVTWKLVVHLPAEHCTHTPHLSVSFIIM